MEVSDLYRLSVTQALELARANKALPIQVRKKLEQDHEDVRGKYQLKRLPYTPKKDEEKYAGARGKYQSRSPSYIPKLDELSVARYISEQYATIARYEEASMRPWKHDGGVTDITFRSPCTCSKEVFLPADRLHRY